MDECNHLIKVVAANVPLSEQFVALPTARDERVRPGGNASR